MNTIPHQDALRSRWTLEGRIPLSGVAEDAMWQRARSVSTGEPVALFIVHGAAALETADAARRAYLVEDPRLIPVRDVVVLGDPRDADVDPSQGPEPLTVVEYAMPTAPPLAALLRGRSLHPETARSIIGEAAKGVETARRRGVRHQFLDSNRVFVDTASGQVSVLGVGVEAASHPGLERSGAIASFQDTSALVALLYRALAGRSPQQGTDGHVPRPSEVTQRPIPTDLDVLCDLVLNESAEVIPETSRELIAELEPWQSIPVTLEAYERDTPEQAPTAAAASDPVADSGAAADAAVASDPTADSGAESADTADEPRTEAEPSASSPGSPSRPNDAGPLVPPTSGMAGAAGATGAVGAAGAAGAAAIASASAERTDAASHREAGSPASPSSDHELAPGPQPEGTHPVPGSSGEQSAQPSPAVKDHHAEDAQALIQQLHLDQKRNDAAFPGHLEITLPPTPAPEQDPTASGEESGATAGNADGEGTAGPAGAPGTGAVAAAAAGDLPSRRAGTDWPLAPRDEHAPAHPPVQDWSDTGRTPESASTSAEAAAGSDAEATARMGSVQDPEPTGPIVVRGRERSALEGNDLDATVPMGRSALLRDVVSVAVDKDDPDAFAMEPLPPEQRSRVSQWILLGGVLAVILAMVLAVSTITSGFRDRVANPLNTKPPQTSAAPPSDGGGEEPAPEEPTEEAPAATPAELAGVEVFTLGSDKPPDNADQTERMTDGDPGTFWSTQIYHGANYAGTKDGVGVYLDLGETSTLTAVVLTTARNSGGAIELRAVAEDGSMGDVLATGEFAGDGEVHLAPEEPVEAQRVALWFPELPADSERDGFRGRIAEVRVE
ncbi:hypothetical protein [Brachybacterium muris]|uniref:Serine/threonine protein kinase n=1 Tax=Brachybacterium muris UCD-AY4 TaxID=1249481 RepID=A0A022KZY5_9MICO|nr:hypothetical protein [Brachybacterium muris]EYT48963.1 hypothetical protein D641_0110005 [Brachybacterium muris UCD-AY4]